MVPFYEVFPDLAETESKVVVIKDNPFVPGGEYSFIESYCNQVDCDCRRVYIFILSAGTGSKVLATINYGWEPLRFYQRWLVDKQDAVMCKGPSLLSFTEQTQYASALLELFEFLISDQAYVELLKKHYRLFKDALLKKHKGEISSKDKKKKVRWKLK